MQKLLNQITKCQGGENGKVSTKISIQFEISAVQAFNELKDNRISQVELVHPDYIVHPDLAIGAVLTQDNKPITNQLSKSILLKVVLKM